MKKGRVEYITKISVLAVISALLMLLEFPLPFAPAFYELDLSEIAVLISGFALGPMAGVLTELIKVLLNLLMNGTATAFVGEISNFVIGVSFVLPASLIYKYRKNFSGALIGMVIGTLCLAVIGAFINYYVLVPAYSRFFMPMEKIVAMGTAVNSNIDGLKTLVLFATVPFNFLKGVICSVVTALVYKRVSPILHKKFSKSPQEV
ncbi:MAG: ECF transporter S component [Clostridia bacterium]|nr:ECF transporter S component [Clostridia bacterium]